jgi:uncharacterized protein YukE
MFNVNEKTLDAYQQKVRAQIKEMKAKMQMFEANTEKAGADMRIKYQEKLNDWKSRFKDVEMKLDKLSETTEENWDDIRSNIDETMQELRNTLENATKQFKN